MRDGTFWRCNTMCTNARGTYNWRVKLLKRLCRKYRGKSCLQNSIGLWILNAMPPGSQEIKCSFPSSTASSNSILSLEGNRVVWAFFFLPPFADESRDRRQVGCCWKTFIAGRNDESKDTRWVLLRCCILIFWKSESSLCPLDLRIHLSRDMAKYCKSTK